MENAGLIFNDSIHYIDHLAPFCSLQKWPLLVVEDLVAEFCKAYYPNLEVIQTGIWNIPFPKRLVSCYPEKLLRSAFPFMPAPTQMLWLPHGNSDKGWKFPSFEALSKETALIYGKKMGDFLSAKNPSIPTVSIGNFRLHYWMQHRGFYDELIAKTIPFREGTKVYLYAPTWDDAEKNCSFWDCFSKLKSLLPDGSALLIKVHPNTEKQYPEVLERLKGSSKQSPPHIWFLESFPPIYPLLNRCSAYIGDMSSIGYDFLYWNRPMYFINQKRSDPKIDPSLFLHRCGHSVLREHLSSVFSIPDSPHLQNARRQVYAYTFDKTIPPLKNLY